MGAVPALYETFGTLVRFDRDYRERVSTLLNTPWPLELNDRGEQVQSWLKPRVLPLTEDAETAWRNFYNHTEAQLAPTKVFEPIRAFGNKAAEHVGRLAGVLTLYADLQATAITLDALKSAITLIQYHLAEALRLTQATASDPDLILAERLLHWAQAHGPEVALVDLYQRAANAIKDAATARRIAMILVDHGYFKPVPGGKEIHGKYRREVWEVKL